jgi:hypothetical protein
MTWLGSVRFVMARQVWKGVSVYGKSRHGSACFGTIGQVCCGKLGYCLVRLGSVWQVRYCAVRCDRVRCVTAGQGTEWQVSWVAVCRGQVAFV